MQPPETDPTRMPSSRIAASEPGGRGLAPKVCATVRSQARRPDFTQSRARSRTSRSRLCIPLSICPDLSGRGSRREAGGWRNVEELRDGLAILVEAAIHQVVVAGALDLQEFLGAAHRL